MILRKRICCLLVFMVLCAHGLLLSAQTAGSGAGPLLAGLEAYARSDWPSAVLSFRKAAAENPASAEPWYWLILSEISAGDLEHAFSDIDRFILSFSADRRVPDVLYQRGRILFLTGSYDEAVQTLNSFVHSYPDHWMTPSAYYWIAETLFACGRFEEAENVYAYLIDTWPSSAKREASVYRLALIEQKSEENSLLELLKASHEETLRIVEDYQRRERTFEQAVTAYQKRISDMMKDTRLADLEHALGEEKRRNAALAEETARLEAQNADLLSALVVNGIAVPESARTEETRALESANAGARQRALEELRRKAERARAVYESGNGE